VVASLTVAVHLVKVREGEECFVPVPMQVKVFEHDWCAFSDTDILYNGAKLGFVCNHIDALDGFKGVSHGNDILKVHRAQVNQGLRLALRVCRSLHLCVKKLS